MCLAAPSSARTGLSRPRISSSATGLTDAHLTGVHLRLPGWGDNGPRLRSIVMIYISLIPGQWSIAPVLVTLPLKWMMSAKRARLCAIMAEESRRDCYPDHKVGHKVPGLYDPTPKAIFLRASILVEIIKGFVNKMRVNWRRNQLTRLLHCPYLSARHGAAAR